MEALEPDDPRYIDCSEVRGVNTLYHQMILPLNTKPPTVQLFSGHLGDGKTTLLKTLQKRFEDDGHFVAYGEADNWLDLQDVDHEDLLLGLLVSVDQALRNRYRKDSESNIIQQIRQRIFSIAQTEMDVKAGIAGLTVTLRDLPDRRRQVRNQLREARGPSFLDVVNEYLDRATNLVVQRGHKGITVLLDNLDRAPEIPGGDYACLDEKLFLSQGEMLARLHCHTIFVIRLVLAHSQMSNLKERYGRSPILLPMIPVRRIDGSGHADGLAKLHELLEARVRPLGLCLADTFHQDASTLFCRKSGGHLRDLMSLVQRSLAEAYGTHKSLPVSLSDAEAAVRDHSRPLIAYDHRDALKKVHETHQLTPLTDKERHDLLTKRLVYNYRPDTGRSWYDVAPLCEEDKYE